MNEFKIQEIEIRTSKQLKEVLVRCEHDDFENLPLFAIRKFKNNQWEDWFLDYRNGLRYADANEVIQTSQIFQEGFNNKLKVISL
jgi:hypothetical protein